jgi:hypothetical protein
VTEAKAYDPAGLIPAVGQVMRDMQQEKGPLVRPTPDDHMVSGNLAALAKALAKAQAALKAAKKDSDNPFYKSKYASLESVLDAIRGPFTDNGLAFTQVPDVLDNGTFVLVTRLMHEGGGQVVGRYPIVPIKTDPQGYGSAVYYARRYSIEAMSGVARKEDDDDGNAASHPPDAHAPQKTAPVQQKAAQPTTPQPHAPSRTTEQGGAHWKKAPKQFTVDELWEEILTRINTVTGASDEAEGMKVLKAVTKTPKFDGWNSVNLMRTRNEGKIKLNDPWQIVNPWNALNVHPVYGWKDEGSVEDDMNDIFGEASNG